MSQTIDEILASARISDLYLKPCAAIAPEAPLRDAFKLLDEGRRPAIVVCGEGREVLGIFTQRDVLYRTALEGMDPETPIRDVMTADPKVMRREQPLAEALDVLLGGFRQVPLVDDGGALVGMLTTRDILGFVTANFPEVVHNLPPTLHQTPLTPEGG